MSDLMGKEMEPVFEPRQSKPRVQILNHYVTESTGWEALNQCLACPRSNKVAIVAGTRVAMGKIVGNEF